MPDTKNKVPFIDRPLDDLGAGSKNKLRSAIHEYLLRVEAANGDYEQADRASEAAAAATRAANAAKPPENRP